MSPPLRDALIAAGGVAVASLVAIALIVATQSALLGTVVVLAAAAIGGVWFAARRFADGAHFILDAIRKRRL